MYVCSKLKSAYVYLAQNADIRNLSLSAYAFPTPRNKKVYSNGPNG